MLAAFVKETGFEQIPVGAASVAKELMLDTIGVALAGKSSSVGKIALRYVQGLNAQPKCTVFGANLSTSPADAAFCNGVMGHALEYDDAWPETIHPSSMVFSAAFAAAESSGRSGSDLLAAYILGLEVLARIRGAATNITHTRGWHASSVYGAMGSAAAAAKALDLDENQICWALGIAACGAGGFGRQKGHMAKPYQQGNAARQGVMAALLAKDGLTSDEDIMQGHGGFMAMFHEEGQYVLDKIVQDLGKRFHLVSPGASIRKYPCPMVFQGIVDSLVDIVTANCLRYEDIDRVRVLITHFQLQRYDDPRPATCDHAKFSLNFVLATALRYGNVRQDNFPENGFYTAEIDEAIGKIRLESLPGENAAEIADPARYQPDVHLRMKDGREFSHRVKYPRGRYDDPTPKKQYVVPKFRDNAKLTLSNENISRCIALVHHVEELETLDVLANALRGDA
jgi:2-methylcitrate dehydratase PrpD